MIFNLPHQNRIVIDWILSNKDKMTCTISKPKSQRSIMQNKYYWFMLGILENDTGMSTDDFHIYFRSKFLQTTKEINGEMIEYTQSTTELSTMEAEDYYSKIRVFASQELGSFIPLPNESDYDYLKL